jgi:hypothetical protein
MNRWTEFAEKIEKLRNLVLKGCPLGHDFNNSNCPLRNVRKLATEHLDLYVNSLSGKQIDKILNYHEDCKSYFSVLAIEPLPFFVVQKGRRQ